MIRIRETDAYARWFERLKDREARSRILARIRRLSLGNPGDVKSVGGGVSELRIDYGPGYRVYFVQRGETVIVLLGGGDKSTQAADIRAAVSLTPTVEEMRMAKAKKKVTGEIATRTRVWDAAEHLKSDEDIAAYLNAAFEDGDPVLIAAALGDIARAKGMTNIARSAGLGRESLYKALSPQGRPELATVMKVVQALGLKLTTARP